MPQRYDLVLTALTSEQIRRAKEANGKRRRITHALICGPYGQMFGTENECWKYYATWREIFPELFEQAYQLLVIDDSEFAGDFESTGGLVLILMDVADRRAKPKTPTIMRPVGWKPGDPDLGCLVSFLLLCAALSLLSAAAIAVAWVD